MPSHIQWTDETWNPLAGCSPVSEGCRNCYAAKEAIRLAGNPNEKIAAKYEGTAEMRGAGERRRAVFTGRVNLDADALQKPLRWRKPRRVFVNSMSDLFHELVPDEFIAAVFGVMAACPEHTFQVLTKRPERAATWFRYFNAPVSPPAECMAWAEEYIGRTLPTNRGPGENTDRYEVPAWPLRNVWLGTSVENQAAANARIPHLLRMPAAVRFLSCEPLLGPVELTYSRFCKTMGWGPPSYPIRGEDEERRLRRECGWLLGAPSEHLARINWVITGGESGPGARPMHPDWARGLRDQCQAARTPFFFKQWGEWAPWRAMPSYGADRHFPSAPLFTFPGRTLDLGQTWKQHEVDVYRVGKKVAGRELDGRTWDEFPEAGLVDARAGVAR